jgi:hypothetical protein
MTYNELRGDTGKGLDLSKAVKAGDNLLRLVHEWRERLGADRSLLDYYLAGVLTAMTSTADAFRTVGEGFEYGTARLRDILRNIKEGNENEARTHPFYPKAKSYMDAHPLPQDAYTYDLYCVGLFWEFVPFAIQDYMDECNAMFQEHLQEENVLRLREALLSTNVVTANDLDLLQNLFLRAFTWVTPSNIFAQGMADMMMLVLIGQDEKSDKYVFQRILDGDI